MYRTKSIVGKMYESGSDSEEALRTLARREVCYYIQQTTALHNNTVSYLPTLRREIHT